MKLKRCSIAALIAGAALFLVTFVVPLVLALRMPNQGSVGIIGGADSPTAQFLTMRLLSGWRGCGIFLGVGLMVSGLFGLIFSNTVDRCCELKTTGISLGLSAVGGTGLYCFLVWFAMTAFQEVGKHPVAYPVSIALGLVSLAGFCGLLALYFRQRKQNWSWGGIVIDVATSILYLPTFFSLVSALHEMLGG